MTLKIIHWQVASSHQSTPILTIKALWQTETVTSVVNYSSSNRKLEFTRARLLKDLPEADREKLVHEVIGAIRKTMLQDIGTQINGLQEIVFSSLPRAPRT